MVAGTDTYFTFTSRRVDNINAGLCLSPVYLCNILKALPLGKGLGWADENQNKEKIKTYSCSQKATKDRKD